MLDAQSSYFRYFSFLEEIPEAELDNINFRRGN